MRGLARALWAIARRDLYELASYRSTFVSRPAGVVFTLALFYYVSRLIETGRFATPDEYFAFVAVGIVIQGLIRTSLGVPQAVREHLLAGTFERMELAPSGATVGLVGMLITPFLYALALGAFTLVVAAGLFGVDVDWATAPLAIPIGFLGALAFAPIALAFAALVIAFKQAPGQGAVLPVLSLAAGLYFPVDLLPGWARWISDVQPLTPTVDLLRHVLVGLPLESGAAGEVLALVGFCLVGMPAGILAVSASRRLGRRRGTILES